MSARLHIAPFTALLVVGAATAVGLAAPVPQATGGRDGYYVAPMHAPSTELAQGDADTVGTGQYVETAGEAGEAAGTTELRQAPEAVAVPPLSLPAAAAVLCFGDESAVTLSAVWGVPAFSGSAGYLELHASGGRMPSAFEDAGPGNVGVVDESLDRGGDAKTATVLTFLCGSLALVLLRRPRPAAAAASC